MRDLGRQPADAEIVFIVDALDSSILAEQRNQVAGFKACSGASTMQMNAQADAQRQRLELRARRLQIKTSNAGDQHRPSASARNLTEAGFFIFGCVI